MLMEKATCRVPQEEKSMFFPLTSLSDNDNLADDTNHQKSNFSSMDTSNEILTGYDY